MFVKGNAVNIVIIVQMHAINTKADDYHVLCLYVGDYSVDLIRQTSGTIYIGIIYMLWK
jgi:hypothetical protein